MSTNSIILYGNVVADAKTEEIRQEVSKLKQKGEVPKLVIMQVGERTDTLSYRRGATKRMDKVGINVEIQDFDENISEEKFLEAIERNNNEYSVDGILIFMPLPEHINEEKVKSTISHYKDVDCIGHINIAKLATGGGFVPCTPKAVMEILKYYSIEVEGKRAIVIGRSMVVGNPVSMLLLRENATVTIAHTKTKNLETLCQEMDIIVVAIGSAKFIKDNYISPKAVVIDVGINMDEEGKLCGDADFKNIVEKVHAITPVPKGVGAVTTTVLAEQVLQSYLDKKRRHPDAGVQLTLPIK